jgi:hypothetical protein
VNGEPLIPRRPPAASTVLADWSRTASRTALSNGRRRVFRTDYISPDRNVPGGKVSGATISRRLFRLATLHVSVWNFFGNLRRCAIDGNRDYEPNHVSRRAFRLDVDAAGAELAFSRPTQRPRPQEAELNRSLVISTIQDIDFRLSAMRVIRLRHKVSPSFAPFNSALLESRHRCIDQSVGVDIAEAGKLQDPDRDKLDNGRGTSYPQLGTRLPESPVQCVAVIFVAQRLIPCGLVNEKNGY